MSIELVMPSNHLVLCHSLLPLLSIFPSIRVFSNESALPWGGQSIGGSASASVLPMNIQDWFPLGLTGLISLQSQGLSRVFSNATVQKHQFFNTQLPLWKLFFFSFFFNGNLPGSKGGNNLLWGNHLVPKVPNIPSHLSCNYLGTGNPWTLPLLNPGIGT